MAVKFLEPGGDATYLIGDSSSGGLWGTISGAPTLSTDFVHGGHVKSTGFRTGVGDTVIKDGILQDSGTRVSLYIYLNGLPGATRTIISFRNGASTSVFAIRLTSGGVIQLWNMTSSDTAVAQIGSNGSTLSTGSWYRISVAWTITSTSVNRFELFKNAVSDISITDAALTNTSANRLFIGNLAGDGSLDLRISDVYVDDSSSLADTGDIWVTAKRPNANGTTNNFVTQIGSGGSSYGSGHSPQVNERPLSTTNGWSVIAVGSAVIEEYNIESKSTGDIDISNGTIIDYVGWVNAKALLSETGKIIVNGVSTDIALVNQALIRTQVAGSATYPAGTGTDIGISTDTTATTVSLYECGIVVAYIPGVAPADLNIIFDGSTGNSQSGMVWGVRLIG